LLKSPNPLENMVKKLESPTDYQISCNFSLLKKGFFDFFAQLII